MTACLPALSLMDCTSQTVSVQPRALSRRLLGCLLKADSICTASHQWAGSAGVSNEHVVQSFAEALYDRLWLD